MKTLEYLESAFILFYWLPQIWDNTSSDLRDHHSPYRSDS